MVSHNESYATQLSFISEYSLIPPRHFTLKISVYKIVNNYYMLLPSLLITAFEATQKAREVTSIFR